MSVVRSGSTELSGADWFLVTFERMMRAAGQGGHVGLTVLELGDGFDVAVIDVPTPLLEGNPNLSHVEAAARMIMTAGLNRPNPTPSRSWLPKAVVAPS